MPKVFPVLVKNKTEKGHAGAGLAVLVPLNAAAAADPACDAASFYKGADGKPLLVRTMPRRQMENVLRRAERLHFEGNKHKDVQEGRIEDAKTEAKRLTDDLSKSFTVADASKAAGAPEVMAWSTMDARLAAEGNHALVAEKALETYVASMDVAADELLRIAVVTKHPKVAEKAVQAAIKEGADTNALLAALDGMPPTAEKAALACYEAIKKVGEKPAKDSAAGAA